MLHKEFDKELSSKCYKWAMEKYFKRLGKDKLPSRTGFGMCFCNVWIIYREMLKDKDIKTQKPRMVFGSLGWNKKDGSGQHWEFG